MVLFCVSKVAAWFGSAILARLEGSRGSHSSGCWTIRVGPGLGERVMCGSQDCSIIGAPRLWIPAVRPCIPGNSTLAASYHESLIRKRMFSLYPPMCRLRCDKSLAKHIDLDLLFAMRLAQASTGTKNTMSAAEYSSPVASQSQQAYGQSLPDWWTAWACLQQKTSVAVCHLTSPQRLHPAANRRRRNFSSGP